LLKKGTVQLNLHDGTNLLIPVSDPKKPKEDVYKVYDVVKINVKSKEIVEHLKFEENKLAIVHAGINNGRSGKIIEMKKIFGPHASTLTLDDNGVHFDTSLDFVMVLGDNKPIIEMGL
jgi:small subunit ribosomal protein S4e